MSLTLEQRRLGHRVTFRFDHDHIAFQHRGLDRSEEQRVAYHDLPLEPALRVEQSATLRRLGFLFFLFAAIELALGVTREPLTDPSRLINTTWLLVGLACFALRRALRLRYSVFAASFNRGNVCVMRDHPQHDPIVAELRARRKVARLAYTRPVNVELSLEADLAHLQQMLDDGLLTESEHRDLEAKVRSADRSPEAVARSRGERW